MKQQRGLMGEKKRSIFEKIRWSFRMKLCNWTDGRKPCELCIAHDKRIKNQQLALSGAKEVE